MNKEIPRFKEKITKLNEIVESEEAKTNPIACFEKIQTMYETEVKSSCPEKIFHVMLEILDKRLVFIKKDIDKFKEMSINNLSLAELEKQAKEIENEDPEPTDDDLRWKIVEANDTLNMIKRSIGSIKLYIEGVLKAVEAIEKDNKSRLACL